MAERFRWTRRGYTAQLELPEVRLLRGLAKRQGVPILLVTHDPRILDIADRIVAMEDGRITSTEAGASAAG